jgi:hypothetical protein
LTDNKKRDRITIFKDYEENTQQVADAARKRGISKSEFIRNSLRKQIEQDDDAQLVVSLNPLLQKTFDTLAKLDVYAERFASAVVKDDTALSERITKEYTQNLIDKGVLPVNAATVAELYRRKCEELGRTFKDEFVKTAFATMALMLKEEWAKEMRLKKKEMTRGGT